MERTLQRQSLLLTRFYAVAPEKVWRATEADALRIWFGQADSPFDGEALITVELCPLGNGTELRFKLDPILDPRAPDAWRSDFKRLGRLLQQTD
jgi:hypothetical protein